MLIKSIAFVLFLEAIIIQVNAVPLRVVGPAEGSPDAKARVKTATADAHGMVEKMETVHQNAQNGDASSLAKVHAAFGNTPDMTGIGNNIQALKNGKFRMDDAQHPTHIGPGYYDPNTKLVQLGSGFHAGTTPEQRAGQILHEASHAVIGTKDIFNKDGQPTSQSKIQNDGDKSGYKDSHLPEMLNDPKFSKNLHQNADSWRTFGELCRRELERRALEEPDLMKRDEILEARATACAMPPRKPTTPADVKGGKQTTTQGAKTPVKGVDAAGKGARTTGDGLKTTGKPATGKPTTGKPTTARPKTTTPKPKTGKPKTGKPSPARPKTGKPKTGKPTTPKPKTGKPSPARPKTGKPKTGKPTSPKPKTGKPTSPKPKTGKPSPARPKTGKPKTGKPTTPKPKTGKPSPARPKTGKPTTPKPKTGKPTTGKPKTGKPTTGKPKTTSPESRTKSTKPATPGNNKPGSPRGPTQPSTRVVNQPGSPRSPAKPVVNSPARANPVANPVNKPVPANKVAVPANKPAPVNKVAVPANKPAVVSKVAPVVKLAVKAVKK